MTRSVVCGGFLLLTVGVLAATGAGAAPRVPPAARRARAVASQESWRKGLVPPVSRQQRPPVDWKVVPVSKGFRKGGGGGGAGGVGRPLPETVDEFVRESAVVVVGVGAGNDGGFYPPPQTSLQYTTYYLRVIGYLKDETGRRAPFLKILAPGGFLNGGQKADAPLPYLEAGRRYLLYLRPNRGLDWGNLGHTSSPIGRGDEYWTSGRGGGLWWEEEGRLVGYVDPPTHWGLPFKVGVLPWPDYLPFGQAVQRAVQAVERERRGVPLVPRPYEPLTFLND